jgi:hypothetical protein
VRRTPPHAHRPAERGLGGEPDVFLRRELREHVRDLERPSEPCARASERRLRCHVDAVELDTPGGGTEQPGDEVEERRLAGAVGPDHGEQLALADLELDTGDDRRASDVEPEIPRGEDRGCAHARAFGTRPS